MRRFAAPLCPSLVLAAATLVVPDARAETVPLMGLYAFGGYQGYAMGELNEWVDEANAALSEPGAPMTIEDLDGGPSFGAGALLDFGRNWRIYGEYERLADETGGGNQLGSFKVEVSSDAYLVGVTYFFLPSSGKTRFGLGGGGGYYEFKGSTETSGVTAGAPFAGSPSAVGTTIGFHVRAEVDIAVSESMHLGATLGYRSVSGRFEVDGVGTRTDVDWSGFMSRVGIAYVGPLDI